MYGWRLKVRCAPAALRTDTRGRSPAAASHRTFSEGYGTGAASRRYMPGVARSAIPL